VLPPRWCAESDSVRDERPQCPSDSDCRFDRGGRYHRHEGVASEALAAHRRLNRLGALSFDYVGAFVETSLLCVAFMILNLVFVRPARRRGWLAIRVRVAHLLLTVIWLAYAVSSTAWLVRMARLHPELLQEMAMEAAVGSQTWSIAGAVDPAFVGLQVFFVACAIAFAIGNPARNVRRPEGP